MSDDVLSLASRAAVGVLVHRRASRLEISPLPPAVARDSWFERHGVTILASLSLFSSSRDRGQRAGDAGRRYVAN